MRIEEWDCCSGTHQQLENSVGGVILNSFSTIEEAEKYILECLVIFNKTGISK